MLKKSLFFIMLSGFVTTSAFALQPFALLKNKPQIKASAKQSAQSQKYTDFSGTWKGVCSGDANGEDTVTIENDDRMISFDSETYGIGSNLKTDSFADTMGSAYWHTSFYWNEDNTQLLANLAGVFKSYYGVVPVSSSMGTLTVSLDNDQLVIKMKGKFYSGMKEEAHVGYSCTYTRV